MALRMTHITLFTKSARALATLLGLLLTVVPLSAEQSSAHEFTIAFGSCLKQHLPQPFWNAVLGLHPNIFIFAGDNFYADTRYPEVLEWHYLQFSLHPALRKLRERSLVLAIWDDHDYGENDAGADYPLRQQSQRLFRETFRIPRSSRVWSEPGIYDSFRFMHGQLHIQIILLDGRSFRSPLRERSALDLCPAGRYGPNTDPAATMLGAEQWDWLERQLRYSADLRLIVSGTQVVRDQHCWENWGRIPHERRRLFDLIRKHKAGGVVFLSGDRHFAEISRLPADTVGYPLYELTASGLNSASGRKGDPSRYRVSRDIYSKDNFGVLQLLGPGTAANVSLQIRDVSGTIVERQDIPLSELGYPGRKADAVLQ